MSGLAHMNLSIVSTKSRQYSKLSLKVISLIGCFKLSNNRSERDFTEAEKM